LKPHLLGLSLSITYQKPELEKYLEPATTPHSGSHVSNDGCANDSLSAIEVPKNATAFFGYEGE